MTVFSYDKTLESSLVTPISPFNRQGVWHTQFGQMLTFQLVGKRQTAGRGRKASARNRSTTWCVRFPALIHKNLNCVKRYLDVKLGIL